MGINSASVAYQLADSYFQGWMMFIRHVMCTINSEVEMLLLQSMNVSVLCYKLKRAQITALII